MRWLTNQEWWLSDIDVFNGDIWWSTYDWPTRMTNMYKCPAPHFLLWSAPRFGNPDPPRHISSAFVSASCTAAVEAGVILLLISLP
jgi:hypothetical protein